ncbi:hypothetical protein Tco_0535264 [Tanacetum coccineum]
MVACLEKTEGNSDFHEIVDFLASSSIHHALTVSPTIYTSYIEQFWNTASSQTVNDVKQIDATIDSKAVVVTEASIRSSLLFNDADGTACLTNEAIFQNLALMGYEGCTKLQRSAALKLESEVGKEVSQAYTHNGWLNWCERLLHEEEIWKKRSTWKTEVSPWYEGRQSGETEEVKLTDDTKVVEDKSSDINAARQEDNAVEPRTPPLKTSIFDDNDITMAQTLIKMKEENLRKRITFFRCKGVLKESPVKKVKRSDLDAAQIAKDAEIARLVHENELAEMEKEKEKR